MRHSQRDVPTMMRRSVGMAIAIAIIVFLAVGLSIYRSRFGKAYNEFPQNPHGVRNYNRIALGMTSAEVESVIGQPPGEFCDWKTGTGPIPVGQHVHGAGINAQPLSPCCARDNELPTGTRVERWNWRDYWIWVTLSPDGKVIGTELLKVTWHP